MNLVKFRKRLVVSIALASLVFSSAVYASVSAIFSQVAFLEGDFVSAKFTALPGEEYSGKMIIQNPEDQALKVRLYPADVLIAENGVEYFSLFEDGLVDVGTWISLDENEVFVEPASSVEVWFKVAVPEDIELGWHKGAVIMEGISDESQGNVKLSARVSKSVRINVVSEEEYQAFLDENGIDVGSTSSEAVGDEQSEDYWTYALLGVVFLIFFVLLVNKLGRKKSRSGHHDSSDDHSGDDGEHHKD